MRLAAGLLIALVAGFGTGAHGQQVSGITILSYGIYRADLTVLKEGTGSSLSSTRAKNICHVMTTWIVPADDERLFGIAYRIEGDKPGARVDLRRTVRYPDPEKPGSYATMEGTTTVRIGAMSYGGWGIDENQPTGVWTIGFFHGERKLTELNFTVTKDKNFKVVPDERSTCFLVSEAAPQADSLVAGR